MLEEESTARTAATLYESLVARAQVGGGADLIRELEASNSLYDASKRALAARLLASFLFAYVRAFASQDKLPVVVDPSEALGVGAGSNSARSQFYSKHGFYVQEQLPLASEDLFGLTRDVAEIRQHFAQDSYPWIHLLNERALNIALNPALADVAAELLGSEDVWLTRCTLHYKPPSSPNFTPWHFDNLGNTVAAWVSITDSTEANGCLRIAPGSFVLNDQRVAGNFMHFKQPRRFRHSASETWELAVRHCTNLLNPGVKSTLRRFDTSYKSYYWHLSNSLGRDFVHAILETLPILKIELRERDALFFSDRLLHSSYPNRSQGWRIGLAARFSSGSFTDRAASRRGREYGRDVARYLQDIGLHENASIKLRGPKRRGDELAPQRLRALLRQQPFYRSFNGSAAQLVPTP